MFYDEIYTNTHFKRHQRSFGRHYYRYIVVDYAKIPSIFGGMHETPIFCFGTPSDQIFLGGIEQMPSLYCVEENFRMSTPLPLS